MPLRVFGSIDEELSRELFEETDLKVSEDSWDVFHVGDSLQSNRILIFGICNGVEKIDLSFKNKETQEVLLIEASTSLAFPLHDDAKNKFNSMIR